MIPTVSIITPTHDSSFLMQVYNSIMEQKFKEWIVVYNNGAKPIDFHDDRVRSIELGKTDGFVGALKRKAASYATGDILLELDHDDILLPGAVEAVQEAFQDDSVGFVYSNSVRATGDFKPAQRFGDGYGWEYRPFQFHVEPLDEVVAFPPLPHYVSRIWFAPDHLRAVRRSVYEAVGGHSENMRVLDDADLMCRLYSKTEFKHIDKPLYLYRITGENTWLKHNAEIQNNVHRIHDQYIESMSVAWAKRQGLRAVDLGGRFNRREGFESVDLKNADVIADLDGRWPFEDNSVGVVRAYDIIEHLKNPLHTMKELYRVLAPEGLALIQVPSTDGRGAWQDPTHCSFWNQNSFLYHTDKRWAQYIDVPTRFQAVRLWTTAHDANQVCWVQAHLMKLPAQGRVAGQVMI